MTASHESTQSNRIGQLIRNLGDKNGVVREESRHELVRMGGLAVVRALVGELNSPRRLVRWEAAKSLVALADPVAAHALLNALEDGDEDVRWLAAEGLVALQDEGLMTVLSGLTRRAKSAEFRTSAHHVLHDLKKQGHSELIAPVLAALEQGDPQITAPTAAFSALQALKP